MSYALPYPQRERSHSRGASTRSRSSSVGSAFRLEMDGSLSPVQRWNGLTREATDWNALRRDPELWHPRGNCLVYLFERGASRRGPSFRIPYDFLLYSSCRPLIEQSMQLPLQTSLYHPGSTTPPSYDDLTDIQLSHESSYCSLHLMAPSELSRVESFNYHIVTRNFFAWLVGAPLVGADPVSALLDLKVRMDLWRDLGADNFGALFQYVQEQSYGDFEDLEIQMSKKLNGDAPHRPQPYRNLSQMQMQMQEQEQEQEQEPEGRRGRRTSMANFGQRIRSSSASLRKKVSRTFSRSESRNRAETDRVMSTELESMRRAPTIEKRDSLMQKARRRLSWASVPQTISQTQLSQPQQPVERHSLRLQTQDLEGPAKPAPISMSAPPRSHRRPTGSALSQQRTASSHGHSATTSLTSLADLSICACCGKPRKPASGARTPLRAEESGKTNRGSIYSEIHEPNYSNGAVSTAGPSRRYSDMSGGLRRSSARPRQRHSSTHSFVSVASSRSPSVTLPGLEYESIRSPSTDNGNDSPPSPSRSREPSMDRRGRRGYSARYSSPPSPQLVLHGITGSGSIESERNMDQLVFQLSMEEISEKKMGKKKSLSYMGMPGVVRPPRQVAELAA